MTTIETPMEDTLTPIAKLTKDLRKAAVTLSENEARFLVDNYYTMQEQRIRADHQVRSLEGQGEPHAVIDWYSQQSRALEEEVKKALQAYAKSTTLGKWCLSITGIGPVIAAGLMAHIDCTVPTCGHIYRYAGLDPTMEWNKGQKRPWNASLKTLCWKIGESFVKQKSRDSDVYGKLFEQRKLYEQRRNESGELKDQAEAMLQRKPDHAQAETYRQGRLPDGHIHSRAKRWAVKLFLSHFHCVGHFIATGAVPVRPYAFEHAEQQHAHLIYPPNMGMVPGLEAAVREAW